MDNRLNTIASYIEQGIGFVDVGTDHGYLPCEILRRGYTGNVIASDINVGPLQNAIETAHGLGLDGRIEFKLCDGLALCDREKIDTIVIAGMGGDMICRILDEGFWCMDSKYKLILQPMSKAEVLRYWLVWNGFEIENEDLADECGTIYQIIVARFGGITRLSDAELFTGKYELCRNKALYSRRIGQLCEVFSKALEGLGQTGKKVNKVRHKFYLGIYGELLEMRKKYVDTQ